MQLQHVDNAAGEQVREAVDTRPWRWGRGVGVALLSALIVGVPTDVIDTGWFTRMTPVRWWEYPALALTVLLTGLWFAIVPQVANTRGQRRVLGSSLLSAFAVGCPVCNKLVIGVLGVSGALGVWAPIQPVLAVISLSALLVAVVVRWRGRMCATEGCRPS